MDFMPIELQSLLARIRVPMGFFLAALFFYFARPTAGSLVAGALVALPGLLLRAWATGYIRKDAVLAASGPYSITRNPLYLGSFILGLGFCLAGGQILFLVVFLGLFILLYGTVIRREEAHLLRIFPDRFPEYQQRVPLFFPGLRRPERGNGGFSLAQSWKNREYLAGLGYLAAIGILCLKILLF
jgi:protein-S-isoprenylcysteine O-methyltransferase Ste14